MGHPQAEPAFEDSDDGCSSVQQPEVDEPKSDSDSDAPEMVSQQKSKQLAHSQRSSEMKSQRYLKEQRKKRLRMLAEQHQKSSMEKMKAAKLQKLPDDILDCAKQLDKDEESSDAEDEGGVHYLTAQRPQRIVKDGFQLQSLISLRHSTRCHEAALKLYGVDVSRHKRSISYRDARPAYQFISGRLHK